MNTCFRPDSTRRRWPLRTVFARLGIAFGIWLLAEAFLLVAGVVYGWVHVQLDPNAQSSSWALFDMVVPAYFFVLIGIPLSAVLALCLAFLCPYSGRAPRQGPAAPVEASPRLHGLDHGAAAPMATMAER